MTGRKGGRKPINLLTYFAKRPKMEEKDTEGLKFCFRKNFLILFLFPSLFVLVSKFRRDSEISTHHNEYLCKFNEKLHTSSLEISCYILAGYLHQYHNISILKKIS